MHSANELSPSKSISEAMWGSYPHLALKRCLSPSSVGQCQRWLNERPELLLPPNDNKVYTCLPLLTPTLLLWYQWRPSGEPEIPPLICHNKVPPPHWGIKGGQVGEPGPSPLPSSSEVVTAPPPFSKRYTIREGMIKQKT